jgi:hypothetical protein
VLSELLSAQGKLRVNIFIFQSTKPNYDLSKELRRNKRETWYATRYRNQMSIGDTVYLWMAGGDRERGIYGWGSLVSEPYIKDEWDSYGVDLVCKVRFRAPVLASLLKRESSLSNLLIFRAPQASNFLLDDKEAGKLAAVVRSQREEAPF